MQGKPRIELYRLFLDFIGDDIQREREAVNRRMLNVFLWCFVFPAVSAIILLLLVNLKVLPRFMKSYMDWAILIFPVTYSLWVLGSEVLIQLPVMFKKGGVVTLLRESHREAVWRERVCESMKRLPEIGWTDWIWLERNLEIDLERYRYRTRYLTALAGAVFYLLFQGIDLLTDSDTKVTWIKSPMGWMESSSNDVSQLVALVLFLVLFFLSGNQTYHSLLRYLNCARIVMQDKGDMKKPSGA